MIDTQTASQIILETALLRPSEEIKLTDATGRVLRENIYADQDFPPFHRVMMDGIAIRYEALSQGQSSFEIDGLQAAGDPQMHLSNEDACLEVMTGAVLPKGTDTVVKVEWTAKKDNEKIEILAEHINEVFEGQHVHDQAKDRSKGDLLIKEGRRISAVEVAIAASVGKHRVQVSQLPRIAVISTGNELVEITEKPEAHQIRRSNVYALHSALAQQGIKPNLYHLNDDAQELKVSLEKILEEHDVLLLSGGVSKGKFDFLPEVFLKIGVEKLFHRIAQKPGKPFWFGKTKSNKVVFAFPGNPVSTFMCFCRYFTPWLQRSLGDLHHLHMQARLEEDFILKKSDLTFFLQIKIRVDPNGQLMAIPLRGGGSGDHANLLHADGFMQLPPGKDVYREGEVYPVFLFRSFSNTVI